jgi:hypothetical protein
MKRIEIRDRALMQIAEAHLGWGTDDPLEMSDESSKRGEVST